MKIKTRDGVKGSVKTMDKVAKVTAKMRRASVLVKEKAGQTMDDTENSSENTFEEQASDRYGSEIENVAYGGIRQFDRIGRESVRETRANYGKVKEHVRKFKVARMVQGRNGEDTRYDGEREFRRGSQIPRHGEETVRMAEGRKAKSVTQGNETMPHRSIKTAKQVEKGTIKEIGRAEKEIRKTMYVPMEMVQKSGFAMRKTTMGMKGIVEKTVKTVGAAVKFIIAGARSLMTAVAAGAWTAIMVIVVICMVSFLLNSVFGVFFSGEDSGTGMTMQTAIHEINEEYDARLEKEKASIPYDVLEMSGSRAVWKDVLALYSVKVNTDPDNPQEVATMDANKKQLLKEIFWEMNDIGSRSETRTENVVTEMDDGHGNIVQMENAVERTYLYVTVSHKTVDGMAAQYGFTQEQKGHLEELLKEENNLLWSAAMYGIRAEDDQIVAVASSQLGNVGGQPYWSWYGFGSRVEWCACFVSWCANECGYLDVGVIPKFSLCDDGVRWFKDRGQWADNTYEPSAGMIIFFDWNRDGITDHVGIVQKCESGMVYTIEGNAGDRCKTHTYAVGATSIYGYGIPAY